MIITKVHVLNEKESDSGHFCMRLISNRPQFAAKCHRKT